MRNKTLKVMLTVFLILVFLFFSFLYIGGGCPPVTCETVNACTCACKGCSDCTYEKCSDGSTRGLYQAKQCCASLASEGCYDPPTSKFF